MGNLMQEKQHVQNAEKTRDLLIKILRGDNNITEYELKQKFSAKRKDLLPYFNASIIYLKDDGKISCENSAITLVA